MSNFRNIKISLSEKGFISFYFIYFFWGVGVGGGGVSDMTSQSQIPYHDHVSHF